MISFITLYSEPGMNGGILNETQESILKHDSSNGLGQDCETMHTDKALNYSSSASEMEDLDHDEDNSMNSDKALNLVKINLCNKKAGNGCKNSNQLVKSDINLAFPSTTSSNSIVKQDPNNAIFYKKNNADVLLTSLSSSLNPERQLSPNTIASTAAALASAAASAGTNSPINQLAQVNTIKKIHRIKEIN